MINPGDYITCHIWNNSPKKVFVVANFKNQNGYCDLLCEYEFGWILEAENARDFKYYTMYKCIPEIENFVGKRFIWICSTYCKIVPQAKIIYPDGHEIVDFVCPKIGDIYKNDYEVAEISIDGLIVYLEKIHA